MSVKTKLSFMISFIVLLLLAMNVVLNDYWARRNLRSAAEAEMLRISTHMGVSISKFRNSLNVIDELLTLPDGRSIGDYVPPDKLNEFYKSVGPNIMMEKMIDAHPGVLDIMLFSSSKQDKAVSTEEDVWANQFFQFHMNKLEDFVENSQERELIEQTFEGETVVYETHLGTREVLKGFFPSSDNPPYVLGIVLDKEMAVDKAVEEQRLNQVIIAVALLIVFAFCSYLLSGTIIRPIRAILWKVNEVALGRFDAPIAVKSKDELGQLAIRINAMSKNLGIYMNKLKMAFEENSVMKEYLESFINHTTDAIHVVDMQGRVTQVNLAFEELFGWSSEEAIGHVLPLVPEPYAEEEQQAIQALTAGKVLGARETMRMTKSGEWIAVSVTTSPIRDRRGAMWAVASITRDMTSRNKMDELLRQSEKLTTVGQLAAGVAHEIRNPLTTLRGFLQLQQQTNKFNVRHTDIMLSELDRINLIVGEFLILAKPQASKFEIKDVRFVLGDVISLLDSQAHLCNVIFITDFCEEPCEISCEENQLKQVFINILKNAIEAMLQGGEIWIRVKPEGRHIKIEIKDSGSGIPEEMISKIGNPFVTGKETGTGLGIMVSQRIIDHHHGMMEISSTVDVGTTVTIALPTIPKQGDTTGGNKLS
ncbi:PAS domain S-box protein [Paenibacillaceae bacterium]|nr:PAS domain S-box protein [Paenibacillaceae bacterium]